MKRKVKDQEISLEQSIYLNSLECLSAALYFFFPSSGKRVKNRYRVPKPWLMGPQWSIRIQPFPTFVWNQPSSPGGCGPRLPGSMEGNAFRLYWAPSAAEQLLCASNASGDHCVKRVCKTLCCALLYSPATWGSKGIDARFRKSSCYVVRKGWWGRSWIARALSTCTVSFQDSFTDVNKISATLLWIREILLWQDEIRQRKKVFVLPEVIL